MEHQPLAHPMDSGTDAQTPEVFVIGLLLDRLTLNKPTHYKMVAFCRRQRSGARPEAVCPARVTA
jgi:hypothetical protein